MKSLVLTLTLVTKLQAKQTLSLNENTSTHMDAATAAAEIAAGHVQIHGNADDIFTNKKAKQESTEIKRQEQERAKQAHEASQRYQNSQAELGVEFKAPPLSR